MAKQREAIEEPINDAANDASFAEQAAADRREYPPEPNPRHWAHDSNAGVEYRTHREPYEAQLAFKDKPSPEVLALLKDNGFRWNNQDKIWTRPVGYNSQAQDRLVAQRVYRDAVDLILEEKGLAPERDNPVF